MSLNNSPWIGVSAKKIIIAPAFLKFGPKVKACLWFPFSLKFAALIGKGGRVNLSLVNIDTKNTNQIVIDLKGGNVEDFSASILTSENLQDHNTLGLKHTN